MNHLLSWNVRQLLKFAPTNSATTTTTAAATNVLIKQSESMLCSRIIAGLSAMHLTTTTPTSPQTEVPTNGSSDSAAAAAGSSRPVAESDEQELDDLLKRVVVQVKGHDSKVLRSYTSFLMMTARELELDMSVRNPQRFIERWTVLKSRFSNRKHMRQYEMRTHFKEFRFHYLTGSTCSTLLEYIQRNLPEGVAMHVHQTRMLQLPEHIRKSMRAHQSSKHSADAAAAPT